MRLLVIVLVFVCAIPCVAASANDHSANAVNLPAIGADQQTYFGPPEEPPLRLPSHSLDQPVGTLYLAGTTWYDFQHNGSAGKMISVDDAGYVHLVWMKGLTSVIGGDRRIYYNVWDPITQNLLFGATGTQTDGGTRAGYASQALLPGGWCFPAYHESRNNVTGVHATESMAFQPRAGSFTGTQPAYIYEAGQPLQLIWPKVAVGHDSTIHMISTESPNSGNTTGPDRIYYSRGRPRWDNGGNGLDIAWQTVAPGNLQFKLIDTVMTISADVAASKVSSRVAMVWVKSRTNILDSLTRNQYNNDLIMSVSEDGGLNWGPHINMTNFTAQDTFRAYADASVIFDSNDLIHVAFTTGYLNESQGVTNFPQSVIWHWDESHQQFSAVAVAWYNSSTAQVGAWQRMVHRPSLACDPVTGYMYCSYQKYDTSAYSTGGFFMGDAWVSVSTDNGLHWSAGRNVTDTRPQTIPAPVGQSLSERDITIADRITYSAGIGYLHMEYVLDLDAGAIAQSEGTATNNPVYYQRISVNDLPHTPPVPRYCLHPVNCTPPTPVVVMMPVSQGLRLDWNNTYEPFYKIYSSFTPDGPYTLLEGTTSDTTFIDTDTGGQPVKFYMVKSSPTP